MCMYLGKYNYLVQYLYTAGKNRAPINDSALDPHSYKSISGNKNILNALKSF